MRKLKLGDSELELLRYVLRNPDCTVREASDHFSAARGWKRTTVLKTFDRLREKEMLSRQEKDGVFRHRSNFTEAEIEEELVHQFLSQSMQGSLKSFVAYLDSYKGITAEDIDELRKLVTKLEEKQ